MTAEFKARISRVRMKGGGADVHVIDRQPVNPDGDDWRGLIVKHARRVADQSEPSDPLVGFLVLGLYAGGGASVGFRYDTERSTVPKALLPHWVSEILRRDIIVNSEARDVFDDMFEWQEGSK